MIRGRIQIRAQAVLRLYDGFTGRPVESSLIRLVLPEGGTYTAKPGGCFVLMNCPEEWISIKIESPVYQGDETEMDLAPGKCGGQIPMKICRLSRGAAMAMPEGTTYVEGTAKPGTRIRLFLKTQALAMRLLEDYGAGDGKNIYIYHGAEQALEGGLLYIQDKSGAGEFFTVENDMGQGHCRMEQPLEREYRKVGGTVYQVYEGCCDAEGQFSIPLVRVPCGGCVCVLTDSEGNSSEFEIACGERNRR